MSLQQFLTILQARCMLVVLVLLGTVAAIVAASLALPKKYTAMASVVVDVKSPDPISGVMLGAMVMPGYMATQRDIISSDRVAQKVVRLLELDEVPGTKEQWLANTHGKGKLDAWLAERLQKKLGVKPSRESNVIDISYSASDPGFAAAVANAFAQAYIDASIELRVEPARHYARWFSEQDKGLRQDLEKAQARLSDHQQKYGIVASDERFDSEITKLNDLSAQLTVVQGQTADARSKQRSGSASSALPEVVQNPLIHTLKGDIARQEAKLQEIAGNLGRNHPQYQRMESELASLKRRLEIETRLITSGFGAATAVGKEKEAELVAAVAAQKQKLLELKQAREQLAALQHDLDIAQKAYESVSQRFTQSKLESQVVQTNASMLTLASEPVEPSFPNLLLNTLAAILLGTFGGVGVAFGLEILDRRIRSAHDVAEMLQLPMLGVIPRRKRPGRLSFVRTKPALLLR
jgi:succinoglycan biosynthesis transport protein ExoP